MARSADPGDLRWMALALGLGRRGHGRCWPNPAVGCVIVRDGRVVGRGWTQSGGRPHAEPMALEQAGPAARGATAYVTLEPCAHHGITPPCTQALISAGISRVVTAMEDPDPRVDGGGHAQLRAAGLDISTGIMAAEAARDHRGFVSRVRRGRPMVTLKLATTLDGRIATAAGESQWITGPTARLLGHALRARHDAVMVGAGTVRADDPTLTVRGFGTVAQPVRIAVSGDLDLPVPSNLTRTLDQAPLWVVHAADASCDRATVLGEAGANLLPIPRVGKAGMAASDILTALGTAGLTRVYCEGGGGLAASLLEADLVDELVMFSGGVIIGADGRPAIGPLSLEALVDAPRFTLLDQHEVGGDMISVWGRAARA